MDLGDENYDQTVSEEKISSPSKSDLKIIKEDFGAVSEEFTIPRNVSEDVPMEFSELEKKDNQSVHKNT